MEETNVSLLHCVLISVDVDDTVYHPAAIAYIRRHTGRFLVLVRVSGGDGRMDRLV